MQSKEHWEKVYTKKTHTEVSWFQEHAALSVKLIRDATVPASASIIDVGGGSSTLVDDLLALDYEKITVLDLSSSALATAKNGLASVHHTSYGVKKMCWRLSLLSMAMMFGMIAPFSIS